MNDVEKSTFLTISGSLTPTPIKSCADFDETSIYMISWADNPDWTVAAPVGKEKDKNVQLELQNTGKTHTQIYFKMEKY